MRQKVIKLSRARYQKLLQFLFGDEEKLTRKHHAIIVIIIINAFTILPFPGSTMTQIVIVKVVINSRRKRRKKRGKAH